MKYTLAFALLIFATSAEAHNVVTVNRSYSPPPQRAFPRPIVKNNPVAPIGIRKPVQK